MAGRVWGGRPTSLVVSSVGGDVDPATAIVDYLVLNPVPTCGTGQVYSSAVVIVAAGKKGFRFCTPNTQWYLHQAYYTELSGNKKELARERRQLERFEKFYVAFLAQRTNRPAKFWKELMDAETYISAEQALEYGLVDAIA